jgi:hypothetical protein
MLGSKALKMPSDGDNGLVVEGIAVTETGDTDTSRVGPVGLADSSQTPDRHPKVERPQVTRVGRAAVFFLVSFVVALAGVITLAIVGSKTLRTTAPGQGSDHGSDEPFPNSVPVVTGGIAQHVSDAVDLNPEKGSDFLFFTWVKLKRGIAPDERVVFVGKYDPASKVRPGYSFGLKGGVDGVRPVVYWQSDSAAGGWFTFSSTQLKPKEWYLFAISFRKGRFLGVHVVPKSSPRSGATA